MQARTEPPTLDRAQYESWARRARNLAAEATTDTARMIHITIAEDYEAKAARSARRDADAAASPPAND